MGEELKFFNIIKSISIEEGFKIQEITKNFMYRLINKDKSLIISTKSLNFNPHIISVMLRDKSSATDYLKSINIPTVEHKIFFDKSNLDDLINYYNKNFTKAVIKDNTGCLGKNVFFIENQKELIDSANIIFNKERAVTICPYENIKNEYRINTYKGDIKLIYKKEKLSIIGNGSSSIKDLIVELINDSKKTGLSYDFKGLNTRIKSLGIDTNEVLELNKKIEIDNLFKSLSKDPFNINQDKKNILTDMALKISKDLGDIPLCIDIIETDKDSDYKVLELSATLSFHNILTVYPESEQIIRPFIREVILNEFS